MRFDVVIDSGKVLEGPRTVEELPAGCPSCTRRTLQAQESLVENSLLKTGLGICLQIVCTWDGCGYSSRPMSRAVTEPEAESWRDATPPSESAP